MALYDEKGMLLIPNPIEKAVAEAKRVLVVCELFCQNGHRLISERARFNGHPGILLKVKDGKAKGLVALSPIFGEKVRVSLDIDLKDGNIVEISCPTCNEKLPVYTACRCGGELIALFLTKEHNFRDCIGVCNRVGCVNSCVITNGEMVNEAMLDQS